MEIKDVIWMEERMKKWGKNESKAVRRSFAAAAAWNYFTTVNLKLIKTHNYGAINSIGMKLSELKVRMRVNESLVEIFRLWIMVG